MLTIKKGIFTTSRADAAFKGAEALPEIAMAGKSNVGKSSTINALCRNGKLAHTSSEPGKTRLINYYKVFYGQSDAFYLTDLPGYGFAKAPRAEREKWAGMIEGYLEQSERLCHVLQLVDIRHEPTQEDRMMIEYLRHYDIPFTVIANKADKLSKAQRSRSIPLICRTLVVQPWEVIPFSAEDGTGKDALLNKLEEILKESRASDEAASENGGV